LKAFTPHRNFAIAIATAAQSHPSIASINRFASIHRSYRQPFAVTRAAPWTLLWLPALAMLVIEVPSARKAWRWHLALLGISLTASLK